MSSKSDQDLASGPSSFPYDTSNVPVPTTKNNIDALIPKGLSRPAASSGRRTDIILEAAAEFLGTLVLAAFGTGGNCQYAASSIDPTYSTVPIGWAVGVALGAGLAGPFSGGHVNPAVSLMLALTGKMPHWKVPIYWFAQTFGAFVGAAITYGVYYHDIDVLEGGPYRTIAKSAGLFGTYPEVDAPAISCWLAEFFPAAILILNVLLLVSMKDRPAFGVVPMVLFITILGIGCTFGSTTSFSINPARDLGPRLLTAAVGYGGAVWTYKNEYWLWGGQFGAYSAAVFVSVSYHVYNYIGVKVPGSQASVELERLRDPSDTV